MQVVNLVSNARARRSETSMNNTTYFRVEKGSGAGQFCQVVVSHDVRVVYNIDVVMVLIDLILPSEGTLGAVFGREAANSSINLVI